MIYRRCIHCGEELRGGAIRCMICGSEDPFGVKEIRWRRSMLTVLISVMAFIGVCLFLLAMLPTLI